MCSAIHPRPTELPAPMLLLVIVGERTCHAVDGCPARTYPTAQVALSYAVQARQGRVGRRAA
jgi:hypothetical protein